MITIPAPTHAREEWADADFDLPEGDVISPPPEAESDKEDDEDWDMEMDVGKTGGAKMTSVVQGMAQRRGSIPKGTMVTIRPALSTSSASMSPDPDGEEDDEGISTIKISALPSALHTVPENKASADDDMEADFALPSDLTQLSLRPLSLHHRLSKASLEWGDRDHTSSSASSSDAYSTLGFNVGASPSSNSTSASLPGTDDDCDDEDNDLDGLVIPTGLFETDQGRKHLTKILDLKKKTRKEEERVHVASPDPEDDFEIGLVINGDDDLSPSKFAQTQQTKRSGTLYIRSNSMPARMSAALRPPSRLKGDRPKTPISHAGSSSQSSSRSSVSPPLRPLQRRTQTFQALPSGQAFQAPSSFLAPKQGVIRNQKSHGVLKSPSPPSSRKLNRKASLSSLLETSNAQASPTVSEANASQGRGYSAATASSRARTHTNSTGRMHAEVPPSRPSTPSSNPAALRLTMPTSMSRLRSRPSISGIFPPPTPPLPPPPPPPVQTNTAGPSNPIRPPSRGSSSLGAPIKSVRRTKRRIFGDGTELDNFEDLPTDGDKEAQFRVSTKGNQNRIPGGSYPKADKESGKGTIRRKRDAPDVAMQPITVPNPLKHKQSRHEGLSRNENPQKRKPSSSGPTRRKPTLIRNLGGVGAPKVVGDMRWNPQTLRWEGNDQALRDFDSMGTSARPALITHLTGTSIGSPPGNFGPATRVVGNMVFDPVRMCWQSTLSPEDDEPDVFADLADDEEDGDWEKKGGTIRASHQVLRANISSDAQSDASRKTPSPVQSIHSRTRSQSQSDSDRGSRASIIFDVEDNFIDLCRAAENRNRAEMKGWTLGRSDFLSSDTESVRSSLYEIRALATRQY
ncbi:hypothetical protein DFH11DRAFT_1558936 [Phellopilus nigrolimitatus]|nr:hypothetical protein DFH11DRAFT_1558936 [Phellopilus nigrolimitatus]